MFLRLFLASLLVAGTVPLCAQTAAGGAEQSSWFGYYGDHPVTRHWGVHAETQVRREKLGQDWEQLVVRPGVDYFANRHLFFTVAYTYQRSWPQEDGSLGGVATGPQPEHRILEGFQGWHPLAGKITLNHRARLEQRFLGVAIEGKGVQDWQYAERFRYRIWPKFPVQAGKFSGYIAPHDEVLLQFGPHHGNRVLNQNRAGILGGWNITRLVQLEIGYLYQYTPRPNGIVDVNNHLLQVNLNSMVPLKQLFGRKTAE